MNHKLCGGLFRNPTAKQRRRESKQPDSMATDWNADMPIGAYKGDFALPELHISISKGARQHAEMLVFKKQNIILSIFCGWNGTLWRSVLL